MNRTSLRWLLRGGAIALGLALVASPVHAGLQTTATLAGAAPVGGAVIGSGTRRVHPRGSTVHRGRPQPRMLGGLRPVVRSLPYTGYAGYYTPYAGAVLGAPVVYSTGQSALGVRVAPVQNRTVGPRTNAEVSLHRLRTGPTSSNRGASSLLVDPSVARTRSAIADFQRRYDLR